MADLQPELQNILLRNGMQAHIVGGPQGWQLAVHGHDSPLLTYPLSDQQVLALSDWGTNSANKKAYSTLTSIIGQDFDMPRNFVYARNANGRVAMGLHGYRIGAGEYGRDPRFEGHPLAGGPLMGGPLAMIGRGMMLGTAFLGWTPRMQEGFHLRRTGGPMVAERPDGRFKPGEMTSGSYGFYYKGNMRAVSADGPVVTTTAASITKDVLEDLKDVIVPMVQRPRLTTLPGVPYSELISSPVYFTNDAWQECLASHGVIIDAERRTLTVQSSSVNADMVYDLRDEEIRALTSNSAKEMPVAARLTVLNDIISQDFSERITMDMLNSKERIGVGLKDEVAEELGLKPDMSKGHDADKVLVNGIGGAMESRPSEMASRLFDEAAAAESEDINKGMTR